MQKLVNCNNTNSLEIFAASLFTPRTEVYLLKDRHGPRLLLQRGGFKQRWKETGWLPAYRSPARLLRFLLRLRYAAMPSSAQLLQSPDCLPRWQLCRAEQVQMPGILQDMTSHRLVARLGTADSRQKLTLFFYGENGRLECIAKTGLSSPARERVVHEAFILRSLPAGVGPEFVWSGDLCFFTEAAGDLSVPVACFRPLNGRPLPARLPSAASGSCWADIDKFLAALEGTERYPADQHPALLRLSESHPPAREWIKALRSRPWPETIVHGDFAPWNILTAMAGIRAFDWEDGDLHGFPGFDQVHFIINTAGLVHRWNATRIRNYAVERLQDTGLQETEAEAVIRLAALYYLDRTPAGEQELLQGLRQTIAGYQ